MKKITTSIHRSFKPVILDLSDLDEIFEIFRQAGDSIEIKTKEYSFEDAKDLLNHKTKVINYLEIKLKKPYISLELRETGVSLYCSENTPFNRGIVEKVSDVLKNGKNKIYNIQDRTFFIYLCPLFLFLTGKYFLNETGRYGLPIITFFVVLYVINIWYTYDVNVHKYSQIFLKLQSEVNFLERNRDPLIVGLIVAVFTVILTVLVT